MLPLRHIVLICFLACLGARWLPAQSKLEWQGIDKGLDFVQARASQPTVCGDKLISILRIDPAQYHIGLYCEGQEKQAPRTAAEWAKAKGLLVVANAGMFQMDGITNVGYMRAGSYVNSGQVNKSNAFFAAGPRAPELPAAQIIDRNCQDWESLLEQYEFVCQGIRMVDCKQANQWAKQPRKWSMVLVAMDKQGRVMLIFTRSPHAVHDLIDMLLALPIDLYNAMYLEGGPEASLFLQTPDCKLDFFGSYETDFFESDANDRAWPIPNVIGIKKKSNP